jgi:hypothetical protein
MRSAYKKEIKDVAVRAKKMQESTDKYVEFLNNNNLPVYRYKTKRKAGPNDFLVFGRSKKDAYISLTLIERVSAIVCEHCGTEDICEMREDLGRAGNIYHYGCSCEGAKNSGKPRLFDVVN